jgi:hypothetical protein
MRRKIELANKINELNTKQLKEVILFNNGRYNFENELIFDLALSELESRIGDTKEFIFFCKDLY